MNQSKPNNARTKIFDELMLFFENILAPYLDERFGGVETRLGGVEEDLDEVKTDLKIVKRGIEILQKTTPNKFDFYDHEKRIIRLGKATFPSSN